MDALRALPPEKRKYALLNEYRRILQIYRSRAFLVRLTLAALPVVGVGLCRILADRNFYVTSVGALIALGAATLMIQSWILGRISCTHRIFLRESEPIRYWIAQISLCAGYLLALFCIAYGHSRG